MILWQLFVSYLKIGFFGFGGGYAMLSLIQHEVVVRHAWMTAGEFADIVAISQITPGPIAINSATYVGYTVGMQTGHVALGILGSAIAPSPSACRHSRSWSSWRASSCGCTTTASSRGPCGACGPRSSA